MKTHQEMTIAERMQLRMDELGLSQNDVAAAAGISQPTVFQILKGEIRRSKYMPEIASALKTNYGWLMQGIGDMTSTTTSIVTAVADGPVREAPVGMHDPRGQNYAFGPTAGKIPVFGYAAATNGREATNTDLDPPIDWVEPPPGVANVKGAYGLLIQDDSMEPRYYHGEIAFVNPRKQPRPGRDAIVEFLDGRAVIKRYCGKSKDEFEFEQFNPPKKIKAHARDVKGLYAVISRGE